MTLPQTTLREFLATHDDATARLLAYVKPADTLGIGSWTRQPFGLVKDAQSAAAQGLSWADVVDLLSRATGRADLLDVPVLTLRAAVGHLLDELDTIATLERSISKLRPDPIADAADPSQLNSLGAFAQISELAGGDVTKVAGVLATPYETCFLELKYRFEMREYQRRYAELQKRFQK